jgi:hypothetical protein
METNFNNCANIIMLFFKRFLFLITETDFALPKIFRTFGENLFAPGGTPVSSKRNTQQKDSGLRGAIARQCMRMRVDGSAAARALSAGESCFGFFPPNRLVLCQAPRSSSRSSKRP